jgi:hypothetical protein
VRTRLPFDFWRGVPELSRIEVRGDGTRAPSASTMTKALERRFRIVREEAREVAAVGCGATDLMRKAAPPDRVELLENVQHYLRSCLIEAEEWLRVWYERRPKRQARIRGITQRSGGSANIGEHLRMVAALEESYVLYRQMIRQIGDGLAWAILRENPRVIAPLYAERSHFLTPDYGLAGATQVIMDAHKAGGLLVIDNDLTRCLGSGDLTVVASDSPWSAPLSVECKTALVTDGPLTEGSEVSVNMTAVVSEDPLHVALHERFMKAVAANVGRDGRPVAQREARQTTEMMDATQLVHAALERRPEVNAYGAAQWKSIRNVINRAMQTGVAYDFPEPGIAFIAARNRPGDDSLTESKRYLAQLQADGFPPGESLLTIGDFITDDELAPVVPPISLWPLPRDQRIALLATDVFLACIFRSDVWERALAAQGLTGTFESGSWLVRGNGLPTVIFDPVQKAHAHLGVAFAGVSPSVMAGAIAAQMRAFADAEKQ